MWIGDGTRNRARSWWRRSVQGWGSMDKGDYDHMLGRGYWMAGEQ